MPLRYYPQSKIKPNKTTKGGEFILNGSVYVGKYYETFDGKFFTGANPIFGPSQRLYKVEVYNSDYLNKSEINQALKQEFARKNKTKLDTLDPTEQNTDKTLIPPPKFKGEPTSHFPVVLPEDYIRGSVNRYFAKRVNSKGFVVEISEEEYVAIQNGLVPYDVSNYLTTKIMWKLTGPLNKKRVSQYDIRAGIIDTNKRLVETAEKTFLGLVAFIGGKYDKFAKPTE